MIDPRDGLDHRSRLCRIERPPSADPGVPKGDHCRAAYRISCDRGRSAAGVPRVNTIADGMRLHGFGSPQKAVCFTGDGIPRDHRPRKIAMAPGPLQRGAPRGNAGTHEERGEAALPPLLYRRDRPGRPTLRFATWDS